MISVCIAGSGFCSGCQRLFPCQIICNSIQQVVERNPVENVAFIALYLPFSYGCDIAELLNSFPR